MLFNFKLGFKRYDTGAPYFASFPFIVEGVPVSGVSCGISSRFAGNMQVGHSGAGSGRQQNPKRLALFDKLGLNAASVYGLEQIHSHTVVNVGFLNPPAGPADGMVCNEPGIVLSVTVADCLPVYLYDTESGAFGIVHSGWKGTGIALKALCMMQECFSTRPQAVAAVLGPCIGPCCYNVDAGRAECFEKEFGAASVRESGGDFYLDLKAANVRLLKNAGVKNIAVCGNCTFTDENLGSFRREGPENYTRMAALIQTSCLSNP